MSYVYHLLQEMRVMILRLSPHNKMGGEKVHNQNPNNQNLQNQKQQAKPNLQNTQNYNNKFNMETGTELTQSTGEISRILASQRLVGLEIGNIGQYAYQNQNQNQNSQAANYNQANTQLEVEQAPGQISQILAQQSQQKP